MVTDEQRALAEELAPALNKFWKDAGKAVVPDGDVASGLTKLLGSRLLDSDLVKKIADLDVRVGLAVSALSAFQRLGGIAVDGFLGAQTRSKMTDFQACDEQDFSKEIIPANSKANNAFEEHQLMYYWMEPELMNREIGDKTCAQIIDDAVNNWTFKLRLVLRTPDPYNENDANIHMKFDDLGGKGGTLGVANIGGKSRVNQRLLLRFDRAEDWTQKSFLNTATHELGHILGLTHTNEPNHIMSAFANELTEPTAQDIARMQAIWGKSLI